MKIIVAGGTGFVGSGVVNDLVSKGHAIIVLTRSPTSRHGGIEHPQVQLVKWDAESVGDWRVHLEGADAVVNLVGESLAARRWTERQKQRILDSRINSTRALVEGIAQAESKPKVLVNGSAVGYYGDTVEEEVVEEHPAGHDFLARTVSRWEEEAGRVKQLGVRLVLSRSAVVLGEDAIPVKRLALPFRLFIGGPLGSGQQWFPWVHRDDVISAVSFFLENERIQGPFNVSAPENVRMKEFASVFGNVLRRPSWLPVPSFALHMAVGEMADTLVKGQKVVPKRLSEAGFTFRFPTLEAALTDALT